MWFLTFCELSFGVCGRDAVVIRIARDNRRASPDFIALDGFARQVAEGAILIVETGRANVLQELMDRVSGYVGHPGGGSVTTPTQPSRSR